jgi:hypothetical protein
MARKKAASAFSRGSPAAADSVAAKTKAMARIVVVRMVVLLSTGEYAVPGAGSVPKM